MTPPQKRKGGASKHCCYGLCKSDSRTKDYYEQCNFYFISFPKPCIAFKKGRIVQGKLKCHLKGCLKCKKCARWVRLCGRSDKRFNSINNVTKDTYICSLHFVGESGPTEAYPEPVKCESSNITQKKPYKQRTSLDEKYQDALNVKKKQEEEVMETMNQPELASVPINEVIVKSELIIKEEEDDVVMNVLPSALEANENCMHSPFQKPPINAIKTEAKLITERPHTDSYHDTMKNVGVQTPKMFLNKNKFESKKKSKLTFENNPIQMFEQSLEKQRSKCMFYTGLEFVKVKLLLSFLSPVCNNLIYCNSDKSNFDVKNAEERRFTPRQELIITLTYLRCALSLQDLAYRFETSLELVTTIIITWIQLMYLEFSKHVKPRMFVSRQKIKEDMPVLFKEFKNLRVIIMCIEVYCPSRTLFNFEHHDHTYMKNQSSAIYKALIGCTPMGTISFVSPVYEGKTSNREMFIKSKIADLLEPGDLVLVDNELVIKDIIESKGGQLQIPPFLEIRNDFEKVIIKKQRACIEEAIGRVKGFRVLQTELPFNMKRITSQLVFVCTCIVNMNLS